jgi:putative NADH-flavin reductase
VNICILGANGRVGSIILSDALEAGYSVQALVRNPTSILSHKPYRNIILGNVLNDADLDRAMAGTDIIISALSTDGSTTLSQSMPKIIDKMEIHRIKRIITIGTAGILQSRNEPNLYRFQSNESRNKSTLATEDHLRAYLLLKQSNLDWTIVCPTYLPPGEKTGNYRYERDVLPLHGHSISTSDTADFAFKQIYSDQFIKSRVGLAY